MFAVRRARFLLFWCVLAVLSCATSAASAEDGEAPPADESARVRHEDAQRHFEQAHAHYREGRYREAIDELHRAIELDPKSKDLVYDLAFVHEKLGELDNAIAALERYQELETDPHELETARRAVERMRGARREVAAAFSAAPPAPAHRAVPRRRTADVWFLASSGVAVAAAVVGTVFGVRALSQRPDAETGPGRSFASLRAEQQRANDSAQIADVAFVVSLVAGSAATALWFRPTCDCVRVSGAGAWSLGWSGSF